MKRIEIAKTEWDEKLRHLHSTWTVYAPVETGSGIDYELLEPAQVAGILYNLPKPVTPLKKFFLPVKENVTSAETADRPVLVLGPPRCDIMALAFLDGIYLDEAFPDPCYRARRERTTLVSFDCHQVLEHCHCTTYGIEPSGPDFADLSVSLAGDRMVITTGSGKGEALLDAMGILVEVAPDPETEQRLSRIREQVAGKLASRNRDLPGYGETGTLVEGAAEAVWNRYASGCVSCGACSAICPTCSCFLLVDRPGFEKVRQLDTCQYPGFGRVAGGEDSLAELSVRFRNRYMCKYVWKPETYALHACTGCGRCIECCIGQINKNEMFIELSTT